MALPVKPSPSDRQGATKATPVRPPAETGAVVEEAPAVATLSSRATVVLLPEEATRALANLEVLGPVEWDSLTQAFTDEYIFARTQVGDLFFEKAKEAMAVQAFITIYERANSLITRVRPSLDDVHRICLEDAFTLTTISSVLPEDVYSYFTKPLREAGLFENQDY